LEAKYQIAPILLHWDFLGRLEEPSAEPNAFAGQVDDFIAYLRDERGLSTSSLCARRWHVECFLRTSLNDKRSIAQLTAEDIDGFLALKGQQGWCRVSVAASVKALRSFFRYAASVVFPRNRLDDRWPAVIQGRRTPRWSGLG
jgi:site-specific recombinase XerC